jgi:hypothetical protein
MLQLLLLTIEGRDEGKEARLNPRNIILTLTSPSGRGDVMLYSH